VDFSNSLWLSVGLAQVICIINVLLGCLIARLTFHKKFEKFVGIIIGSMAARLVASAIVVWFCISVVKVHNIGFSISFCIGTFIFLFVEIFYFHTLADSPEMKRRPKK
jgi:preprotein translocase subunit SecD